MGGRGTFAAGRSVPSTYKTLGRVCDVKVLAGLDSSHHGLPEESKTSWAYIKLKPDGKTFHEMRIYNANHEVVMDIGYHGEPNLNAGDHRTAILHAHDYAKGGDFKHRSTRWLTDEEYQKYKKYFIGVPEDAKRRS